MVVVLFVEFFFFVCHFILGLAIELRNTTYAKYRISLM